MPVDEPVAGLPLLDAINVAPGETLGVAVSGGSDSRALLLLLAQRGLLLRAVTVDHALRPEAAAEAKRVATLCSDFGISHDTVIWQDHPAGGNLQDQARRARYRLLASWARDHSVGRVALGHTRDDNIETFVMGLMRGAGLDGLSGMRPAFEHDGVTFLRPLLHADRQLLRDWLTEQGVGWDDDPGNDDPAYDRVRVRQGFAALGLDAAQLDKVIGNLRATRTGIEDRIGDWTALHVLQDRSDLLIDGAAFGALPVDFQRRVLNMALRWVAGTDYPPRAAKVMAVLSNPQPVALHGCLVLPATDWRIGREPAAVMDKRCGTKQLWDARWQMIGPHQPDLQVRALGEGIRFCPNWRETGLPRRSLMAGPAIWQGDRLISAPLAGFNPIWKARIVADFQSEQLAH